MTNEVKPVEDESVKTPSSVPDEDNRDEGPEEDVEEDDPSKDDEEVV